MKTIPVLLLLSLLLGCVTKQPIDSTPTIQEAQSIAVPIDAELFAFIPYTTDVWVYQQTSRDLHYLMGAVIAAKPSSVHIFEEPIEFHVGNQFFYEEGLGLDGDMLANEVKAVQRVAGVSPLIVTAGAQWVDGRTSLAVPENFDGWIVFLSFAGEKTMFSTPVNASLVRVRNDG